MLLTNARVIDGAGRRGLERASACIEGGRIAEVSEMSSPSADDALDLDRRTLLPGLIDARGHVASDVSRSPGLGPPAALHGELPRPRELGYFVLAKTARVLAKTARVLAKTARALLTAGVITVRDVELTPA
jgi:cytosine/adenosine deaminase-related metal-dependent hydrolase